MTKKNSNELGQILPLALVAITIVLFSVLFITGGSRLYYNNTSYSIQAEKATALAEAGLDKAVQSLNKTAGSYSGETETTLGDGSYSVTVTNKDAGTKIVQATGYLPNKTNPKLQRTVSIQISSGIGASFNYGLQVGQGGITMGNSATLNGPVYSNGNISGGNTTVFNGDVYVAGGTQPSADQQSDCTDNNCQDYIFGKNVSGENRQDVAQSFKPSATAVVNKISLKLKKTGSPSNPTVRIMTDSNGKPNKNGVLASGILAANGVTGTYNFVEIALSETPSLTAGTTYWIMIHANTLDGANYWYWSNDIGQGYNGGVPKWSVNWQAGMPDWTSIAGDLGFRTYMGGVVTSISGGNGSRVNGNVHTNTISGLTISNDAYYQVINNSTVNGISYPGSTDPVPTVFPISDANITEWKNAAEAADVTSGDLSYGNSCTVSLGPGKITGNVSFGNGCTVTVKSPLWIQGTLSAGNTTIFNLDSSLGTSSGMIIVDGLVSFGNGNDLRGSGTVGSFLMLLSTATGTAMSMDNSSISGIIYAPAGTVALSNGATFKEIVAYGISMGNTASLNYETGLASIFFNSGPSGSYSLIRGTYQVK